MHVQWRFYHLLLSNNETSGPSQLLKFGFRGFFGCTIYDVGERKSTEEKHDGNSPASFLFYNRKQVNYL